MIRVNQAGEYGAKRIYEGQLSVLKNTPTAPIIQHMADQEEEHLRLFSDMMIKRQVRPTILSPFWHVGGFLLGAISARISTEAAMACTVAVEETIDNHYQNQLKELKHAPNEKVLQKAISKCHEEELEHRDTGLEHKAESMFGYRPFTAGVKCITKLAIKLSERI